MFRRVSRRCEVVFTSRLESMLTSLKYFTEQHDTVIFHLIFRSDFSSGYRNDIDYAKYPAAG